MLNGGASQPTSLMVAIGGDARIGTDAGPCQRDPVADAAERAGEFVNQIVHRAYTFAERAGLPSMDHGVVMHILITGGTGLIGSALARALLEKGHRLTIWSRRVRADRPRLRYVSDLEAIAEPCEVVVNLAGAGLADRRWSSAYKKQIRSSRIALTEQLVTWMAGQSDKPRRLVNASAIGFYGLSQSAQFSEADTAGEGFAAQLCADWEAAAEAANAENIEVAAFRLGVVLAPKGGALKKMTQSFRFGVSSWIGSGCQWLSWIHIDDVVGAFTWAIEAERLSGAYNLTAPTPVTHRAFAEVAREHFIAPVSLPLPDIMARVLLGEMAEELLIGGQQVLPRRLLDESFSFRYPELNTALADLLL